MEYHTDTLTAPMPHKTGKKVLSRHIVEIVSDSGEGAQKAGQSFASISAKMGNGVWTVEIIPSDIEPPPRTLQSTSGIRIRIGSDTVTNAGDEADLVVAFNEVAPFSRIEQDAFKKGTIILIENAWAKHDDPSIRESYAKAIADFKKMEYVVYEIPMAEECLKFVPDPKKGKNMWVLGMLSYIYSRDLKTAEDQIAFIFKKKSQAVIDSNVKLLNAGHGWAAENLDFQFEIPAMPSDKELLVMNGNEAFAFGTLAAGVEVCSMYPITPATSVSHMLAEIFEKAGGLVHQAEDEIAAIGFAIGSSYSGKTALTVTSGPGLALKTEFIGLAIMAEVPLLIIDVQRGGPSTGMPTKIEQGDLLAVLYGAAGDAPKIVMAPSTIEECFQFVIVARQIAEAFRTPVFLLSDSNLATGVQPFERPKLKAEWMSAPIDQSAWKEDAKPYQWDEETGLSKRPIPGQKGGEYTLTGLTHTAAGHVSYLPEVNQRTTAMRSRKIAAFGRTLKPPKIHGDEEGDLLLVGWGSTRGAIEEATDRARELGGKVSSVHLRFLSPMEPGLKDIFKRFKKVMTVEINYSDDVNAPLITEENRRYSQLAWILRARTLVDIDCFSNVHGQPLKPRNILERISELVK
ncbi:MAG: 2-oxoacid:acceptor oxidoreductase subunit alpha [Saprospiraceae bacterium]|nr:2-oxoacid:acceptor oxidoreductase subunit alpha [Saprospiraceae bacterium]MCF8250934.1 2-oxoacid:acceptor oxidoreductase subunit alpha [Saprospiraceae bacterium]MCF8281912.1 2-oxoacid:acceptor oxidoreductase subunit alpha [Bacteroidales bacterium]MCF8311899.1 2-oxoacid:acceptor oxidoreductase subunit alpha [Saprospiraceae bacterium]MCF8441907.1 2-oxoacid:acceptor oxidoreductase subunit alpha [Saprospiraceae bacterium]